MAKPVVIENPILNSPYREPGRHFKFSDEEITNEIVESMGCDDGDSRNDSWSNQHYERPKTC